LKFDILRVPSLQIPSKKGKRVLFSKFPRRTNLMALLVTILGSQIAHQIFYFPHIEICKGKYWFHFNKFENKIASIKKLEKSKFYQFSSKISQ
jgi:hypothetical protein